MNKPAWLAFWTLGLIWGSSFLLIRIGVEDIPPSQLVFIRAGMAMIGLNVVRYLRGIPIPRDWPTLRALFIIGIGNVTIPYIFISVGEQYISSGMAAVLQATAALFTLIIAHLVFADEHITQRKVIGLILGFSGIIILSSDSMSDGKLDMPMLLGQLCIVIASLFYANFTVYSRTVIKQKIQPIVVSSLTFISATVSSLIFVVLEPLFGGRSFVPFNEIPSDTLNAALLLGFLNTFLAYLLFYFIVQELGAFRTSMVTYIVPVVGLMLGALILDETVTQAMFLGSILIFTGIAIINIDPLKLRRKKPA